MQLLLQRRQARTCLSGILPVFFGFGRVIPINKRLNIDPAPYML